MNRLLLPAICFALTSCNAFMAEQQACTVSVDKAAVSDVDIAVKVTQKKPPAPIVLPPKVATKEVHVHRTLIVPPVKEKR